MVELKDDGEDGAKKKTASAMLTRLPDCWWHPDSKNWIAPDSKQDFINDYEEPEEGEEEGDEWDPNCVVMDHSWVLMKAPTKNSMNKFDKREWHGQNWPGSYTQLL